MFRLIKLRPPNGWRAVGWELAIVTVGVLIALGAQQAVQSIGERSRASEARREVRNELVADITRVNQRTFADRCVEQRLTEIEEILGSLGADGRINRSPTWIGFPPRYRMENARWAAASQSGRISLLPSEEQADYGLLHALIQHFDDQNSSEQQTWARLEALSGINRLSDDGLLAMRADVAQARRVNGALRLTANIIFQRAKLQHLRPSNRRDPPFAVCWPTDTPTAKGRAELDSRQTNLPGAGLR